MKPRLTTSAVIHLLNDNPKVFVIRTNTKSRGVTYCLSDTLRIIDRPVADQLIEKRILVDQGDTLPSFSMPGQIYRLADGWRRP